FRSGKANKLGAGGFSIVCVTETLSWRCLGLCLPTIRVWCGRNGKCGRNDLRANRGVVEGQESIANHACAYYPDVLCSWCESLLKPHPGFAVQKLALCSQVLGVSHSLSQLNQPCASSAAIRTGNRNDSKSKRCLMPPP